MNDESALEPVWKALEAIPGLEPLPCDGEGHAISGTTACLHLRIGIVSPEREELLAKVAPVVRRGRFVMAALINRRDLYSISFRPQGRRKDPVEAARKLAELLLDDTELDSGVVPDRRGR